MNGFMDLSFPLVITLTMLIVAVPLFLIMGAPFVSLIMSFFVLVRETRRKIWRELVSKGVTSDHLPVVYQATNKKPQVT